MRRLAVATLSLLLSTSAHARAVGDRVLAVWAADGMWYPGRIDDISGREVRVTFDDGDIAVMDAADVRAVDWVVGSRLQCNWQNRGPYYWGKVVSMEGERLTFKYDDGHVEDMTISRCRSMPTVE